MVVYWTDGTWLYIGLMVRGCVLDRWYVVVYWTDGTWLCIGLMVRGCVLD